PVGDGTGRALKRLSSMSGTGRGSLERSSWKRLEGAPVCRRRATPGTRKISAPRVTSRPRQVTSRPRQVTSRPRQVTSRPGGVSPQNATSELLDTLAEKIAAVSPATLDRE